MSTIIRNIETRDEIVLSNGRGYTEEGYVLLRGSLNISGKWMLKNHVVANMGRNDAGHHILKLAKGWEVVRDGKPRKPREPKPQEPVPTPTSEPVVDEPVIEPEIIEEPVVEPQPQPQPQFNAGGLEGGLVQVFAPIFDEVARKVEANIRANVDTEMKELKRIANMQARNIKIITPDDVEHDVTGVTCPEFEDIVQDVSLGYNVYLCGVAGCGKTHTAAQVAEALGLTFYTQTTIQFAHDVRGYGDAGGRFVDTPFYKAFAEGGLYFQDEYDRSFPEAAIVLNTALANGYYDFPVVGRVKAHKDFRFMAAGNTHMKGAENGYVTGQEQDASSIDRFGTFYEMNYDRRVEASIAEGDDALLDFVADVRNAMKINGTSHIVSYRATDYAHTLDKVGRSKEKILERGMFKGLELDIVRTIYGSLENPNNIWAKALRNVVNL